MVSNKKIKQISNYDEKYNGSSLTSSNKRMKKTWDVQASIITALTGLFDIF